MQSIMFKKLKNVHNPHCRTQIHKKKDLNNSQNDEEGEQYRY